MRESMGDPPPPKQTKIFLVAPPPLVKVSGSAHAGWHAVVSVSYFSQFFTVNSAVEVVQEVHWQSVVKFSTKYK